MIASRRTGWNFALQRAVEWARKLRRPLVILEALRCDYPWASDRLHRFVLDGMADHAQIWATANSRGVHYYPYVEPHQGAGRGLVEALAQHAAVVVTDDYPCFFLPRMVAAVAQRTDVLLEAVDSNGLLPLRAADRVFTMAFHFRRWLQKHLRPYLAAEQFPLADPLAGVELPPVTVPVDIAQRWPAADLTRLRSGAAGLASLPIDHAVRPGDIVGGDRAAEQTLRDFLQQRLPRYADERNIPDEEVASGLSPYLHFGHVSVHQVFHAAMQQAGWSAEKLSPKTDGKAEGWWGVSPALNSFVDELITWREIGFNFCSRREDYDRWESLPEWCRTTLELHATDRRAHVYTREQFERAQTHDPLWNAAQRQLVREGRLHNYLRMLWGKKVLEWSSSPQEALATLIHLNNKYALDGRDPNSYSGIFWCLGRYDRPWAPERPIFGMIRYMSSENTARKVRVKAYLKKYGSETPGTLFAAVDDAE
jgi:deoxyribodipyrimidine photo-lyase